MKLLYIANIRLPTEKAHGLQIMKTCEALAQAGTSVELVVPARENVLPEDPFAFYGVSRTFELTKVNTPDFVRFGRVGFSLSAIWFSEKVRWLSAFRNGDLVYSRDALILFQYLLLRRPFVFEAHNRPSFISKIVARHARAVVVISAGLREAYMACGVPEKILVLAPDAVDLSIFKDAPTRAEARAQLGLPGGRIALYAGHLYARKGVRTVAAAARFLPDVLFVFVGGTVSDVEHFRRDWGNEPNIRIVGHVAHQLIPVYLRAADVLMLPNSGKDEDAARFTSPMKLFEYMASGTPIVASDVPSLREVLDEETAVLFSPDDTENLVDLLKNLLQNAELSSHIARNAGIRVEAYTWNNRAKKILAALHER